MSLGPPRDAARARARGRALRCAAACAFSFHALFALPGFAQAPPGNAASAPGSSPETTPASGASAAAPSPEPEPAPVPTIPLEDALELDANATCLERGMLLERVARWLQRDHVDEGVRVHVRGSANDPQAVSFVIERRTAEGKPERAERTMADAPTDCDQLHSALALSIALAIDANPGEAETPLPDDEALLAGPPEPAYFALGAAIFAHASSGLLTDVAPALSFRVQVAFVPWLELRLGGLGSLLGGQTMPSRIGTRIEGTFDVGVAAGRLDVCGVHSLEQLRLLACAGALGGDFATRGTGFSAGSFVQNRLWLAALAGFELQAELGSVVSLAAAVDLVIPLGERQIRVVGPDLEVVGERSPGPVAVLVGVGPVFRFF